MALPSGAAAPQVACAALLWDRLITPERAAMPFYAEFSQLRALHAPVPRPAPVARIESISRAQPNGEVPPVVFGQRQGTTIASRLMRTCILQLLNQPWAFCMLCSDYMALLHAIHTAGTHLAEHCKHGLQVHQSRRPMQMGLQARRHGPPCQLEGGPPGCRPRSCRL